MTKKHFIALADAIRSMPSFVELEQEKRVIEKDDMLRVLADFCAAQNDQFNRERWLGYIAGSNGKNGGAR